MYKQELQFVQFIVKIWHSFLFLWDLIAMADQGTNKKLWEFFISILLYVWCWSQSQHYLHLFLSGFTSRVLSSRQGRRWWWTAIAILRAVPWKYHLFRHPTSFTGGFSAMWWFALVWIPVFCCFCLFLVQGAWRESCLIYLELPVFFSNILYRGLFFFFPTGVILS